jgi:hypothetical protein
MTFTAWPAGVSEELGLYVYVLRDPREQLPFYVGKGSGNRCFAHLAEARKTLAASSRDYPKLGVIRAIEAANLDVSIEILRHGFETEDAAYEVEAACIDLLRLTDLKTTPNLANRVLGRGSKRVGRMSVGDVVSNLGAVVVNIEPCHRVVLIRVARLFRPGMDEAALYEATRSAWRVGEKRRVLGAPAAPDWAMAVYQGVIRAVYRIDGWEPVVDSLGPYQRWSFSGRVDCEMQSRYLYGDVTAMLPQSAQAPLRYVNCC